MASFFVNLDYPEARLPATAGGKGASLARMLSLGLPVPPGFVSLPTRFRPAPSPSPKTCNGSSLQQTPQT